MGNVSRRTVLAGVVAPVARATGTHGTSWVVYYSDKAPASSFQPFTVVILDSRYHPPLSPLLAMSKQVFGYCSLGEAAQDYSYFDELQAEGLLLKPNPVWKGNYSIDIRDSRWGR